MVENSRDGLNLTRRTGALSRAHKGKSIERGSKMAYDAKLLVIPLPVKVVRAACLPWGTHRSLCISIDSP